MLLYWVLYSSFWYYCVNCCAEAQLINKKTEVFNTQTSCNKQYIYQVLWKYILLRVHACASHFHYFCCLLLIIACCLFCVCSTTIIKGFTVDGKSGDGDEKGDFTIKGVHVEGGGEDNPLYGFVMEGVTVKNIG